MLNYIYFGVDVLFLKKLFFLFFTSGGHFLKGHLYGIIFTLGSGD